jgi:hypothetical protein
MSVDPRSPPRSRQSNSYRRVTGDGGGTLRSYYQRVMWVLVPWKNCFNFIRMTTPARLGSNFDGRTAGAGNSGHSTNSGCHKVLRWRSAKTVSTVTSVPPAATPPPTQTECNESARRGGFRRDGIAEVSHPSPVP